MAELDIEQPAQLLAYLRHTRRIAVDEFPVFKNLAGGVSNRTVLVERKAGPSWVMKQALAKLRVTVDWFSDPARVHREALGLRWLEVVAPEGTITPLVFEDHEHHLLAMAAVPAPHDNWKDLLMQGEIDTDHLQQFGRLLGHIHRNSYRNREELADLFNDTTYYESLRIEPYYSYTASQLSSKTSYLQGFFDRLIRDTRSRRLALTHGDYSPKNILVHNHTLILLDHEVIHWGDPAFDIGFAMAHLLSKAHHLPEHRQRFAEGALMFWTSYRKILVDVPFAREMEPFAVRHALACLLARVAGRSTLAYLSPAERDRQVAVVSQLAAQPVLSFEALIPAFTWGVGERERSDIKGDA